MRTKQELYQAALRTVALRRQTARANAEDARLAQDIPGEIAVIRLVPVRKD